ncbi:MAG TPA: phosphoribosylglycinamide formyltransferase, partial [Lacipirellulaceae bacterium]|nr:phosphoribosylglycinamide formyltransferase [Lacipirellulaceae bacterium]
MPAPLKLAVLISGSGRTLKNILDLSAAGRLPVDVRLVVSSSGSAGGLEHARAAGVPTVVLRRSKFDSYAAYGDAVFGACREAGVDLVAMAGFLKFAPVPDDFAGRVINIHPALVPAFSGAGMYGLRVHQAVLDYGAKITGVTVHFVDNQYDHGPVIWQQPTPVFDDDTPESLAERVFAAELEAYPAVLRLLAAGRVELAGRRVRLLPARRERG